MADDVPPASAAKRTTRARGAIALQGQQCVTRPRHAGPGDDAALGRRLAPGKLVQARGEQDLGSRVVREAALARELLHVLPCVGNAVDERAGQIAGQVEPRGRRGVRDRLVEHRGAGFAMARPEAVPAQLGGAAVGVAHVRLGAEAPSLAGGDDAIALDGHERLVAADPRIDHELAGIVVQARAHVIGRHGRARDDAGGVGGQQGCELLDVLGLAGRNTNHQASDRNVVGSTPRPEVLVRAGSGAVGPTVPFSQSPRKGGAAFRASGA
jgi:hypothetical protein